MVPCTAAILEPSNRDMKLIPNDLDKSYVRPAKTLPRPVSHQLEWATAAKAGVQPSGNWTYGGLVTQICLLGNVAIRLQREKSCSSTPKPSALHQLTGSQPALRAHLPQGLGTSPFNLKPLPRR